MPVIAAPPRQAARENEKCPLCGARSGRRACPALGQEICAVCCGTKRLSEIRCPDSCGYLHSARRHPPVAARRRDERELVLVASALHRTTEQQRAIFALLQTVIARHARAAMPPLLDRDVAEACRALAATFETAARGIIYEQHATSAPAERLASDLRQHIEQALRPSERPVDRDLAVALRATEAMATRAGGELEGGERAYLEFLERKMGGADEAPQADTPRGGRLIIPG
jgi:hypothetical protein